ncbi:MAG: hypothetical protein CL677_03790 [Bdellovibrionaceae bacterium]|nr:hypothetical protein [Pseudobdellovibrionaceae bacterium]
MSKILVSILALGILSGCATQLEKRNEVKDLDTMMDKKENIKGDESVGIKDNKFRIQKKVLLAEELRRLENVTYGIEYEVYGNREYGTKGLYGAYRDCKTEENSVALGGDGTMSPIEAPAPVINEESKLDFGLDEKGDMVGVSEEYLSERIDRFQKYRKILKKRRSEYETKLGICENNIKNAKIKMKNKSAKASDN